MTVDNNDSFDNNDDCIEEYTEDIKQVITLLDSHDIEEVRVLLEKASIIKVVGDSDDLLFSTPRTSYCATSKEEIDLSVYYKQPEQQDISNVNKQSYSGSGKWLVDEKFNYDQGISISKLVALGVCNTPVIDGRREYSGSGGNESWKALGEYCPEIKIDYLKENLLYIGNNTRSGLA